MDKPFLLLLFLLSSCSLPISISSYNVPAIFTFGDSIVDAGNNHFNKNCSVQADFPPYGSTFFHHPTGRFTNGRTVADFISQFLGIELQSPYLEARLAVMNGSRRNYPSNGINFASAGSGVLRQTNQDSAMLREVENLMGHIYRLGGRRIAVFSLGPVGCVPARVFVPNAPVEKCFGRMNVMVKKYNEGLESLVKDIPVRYPGAVGVYGAVYDAVQRYRATPARYGFTNVMGACCGDGPLRGLLKCGKEGYKICPNPETYLFWDYFHPSEHTYKLISKVLWGGKNSTIRPFNLQTLASML
ncbi:hypothetical protein GH714_017685 [Hevea brasiliensis]|uniref:Uncharacterized protein n=1 Tax=Hevea brasiliensis TaxID=3981 RepID=A0A6A6MF40_HEVBR|nr:hypothetical protein GH714_017685 [Hevea brasiliensis]